MRLDFFGCGVFGCVANNEPVALYSYTTRDRECTQIVWFAIEKHCGLCTVSRAI